MFDTVIEKATEIFLDQATTEAGDVVDGSYAWAMAVTQVIKTPGDAIGLAVDIHEMPQLKDKPFIWECDGADNQWEFLRSAFYGMGEVFEPAVVAKVGVDVYNETMAARKQLVNP